MGPDGNLWLTATTVNNNVAIVRITPAGAIAVFPLPANYSESGLLTVGPDGNLWLTATTVNDNVAAIVRITPASAIAVFPPPARPSHIRSR